MPRSPSSPQSPASASSPTSPMSTLLNATRRRASTIFGGSAEEDSHNRTSSAVVTIGTSYGLVGGVAKAVKTQYGPYKYVGQHISHAIAVGTAVGMRPRHGSNKPLTGIVRLNSIASEDQASALPTSGSPRTDDSNEPSEVLPTAAEELEVVLGDLELMTEEPDSVTAFDEEQKNENRYCINIAMFQEHPHKNVKKVRSKLDTGSLHNHMRVDTAHELGLTIAESDRMYELADGSTVRSEGRVTSRWYFLDGPGAQRARTWETTFELLRHLPHDVLLGCEMLARAEVKCHLGLQELPAPLCVLIPTESKAKQRENQARWKRRATEEEDKKDGDLKEAQASRRHTDQASATKATGNGEGTSN